MARKTKGRKPYARVAMSPPREAVPPKGVSPPISGGENSGFSAKWNLAVGATAGLLALVTYLLTLNPTLPPGDSGDLITAAWVTGVPHPPGYPLFTIIAHIFTLLPIGTPAYRVNLTSALFGSATVAIVALLIWDLLRGLPGDEPRLSRRGIGAGVAAVAGALFLAFSTEFWSYSLVAEVFALNGLFAAALMFFAVAWYRDPKRAWPLRLFFLTAGLASTHQQTIILLAPGLGVLLIAGILRRQEPGARLPDRSTVRDFGIGIGFLLIGLLPFLYIPWAASGDPAVSWDDARTLEAFIRLVTRGDYGTFALLAQNQHGSIFGNLVLLVSNLVASFGVGGCVLAGVGLWRLLQRRPIIGSALLLCFLVSGPLFIMFANPPTEGDVAKGVLARFYILPSVPLAVVVGYGAGQALLWVRTVVHGRKVEWPLVGATACAILLMVGATAITRFGSVDQSSWRQTQYFGEDLFAPLEKNALLISNVDTIDTAGWYTQLVARVRPDVRVIHEGQLVAPWYLDEVRRQYPDVSIPFASYDRRITTSLAQLVSANIGQRPVYVAGTFGHQDLSAFDSIAAGFARQLLPTGSASDPFAYVRDHLDTFKAFRFPSRSYPRTSWESWISERYSDVAFDVANALETVDVTQAVQWYRDAIRMAPSRSGSYRNLAVLLTDNGGDVSEIVSLYEQYLGLEPDNPDAQTIRDEIVRLLGATP